MTSSLSTRVGFDSGKGGLGTTQKTEKQKN